jgi:hypothetical protein
MSSLIEDVRLLRRAEEIHRKWLKTRGHLSQAEYNRAVRIRRHFVGPVLKAMGDRESARRIAKRLTYLSFAADTDYFAGYFTSLFQVLSFKHNGVSNVGGLTERQLKKLDEAMKK